MCLLPVANDGAIPAVGKGSSKAIVINFINDVSGSIVYHVTRFKSEQTDSRT